MKVQKADYKKLEEKYDELKTAIKDIKAQKKRSDDLLQSTSVEYDEFRRVTL